MSKEMGPNVIGLTGNMGCGKSTVAESLKRWDDIHVLDCDKISKDILLSSDNTGHIKDILGDEVLEDGKVKPSKVSKIIFGNPQKKQELEDFIHPLVWEKVSELVQTGDENAVFVVESALLYETGQDKYFKGVIVATCDQEEQFRRIKKRNAWSDEEIGARLKHQLPNDFKVSQGWVVVDTNCSFEELDAKVKTLYSYLKNNETGRLLL